MTFEMMATENEASVSTSPSRLRLLTCSAKCFPSDGETLSSEKLFEWILGASSAVKR